jgi:trehalose 6-phosphate phosphatase
MAPYNDAVKKEKDLTGPLLFLLDYDGTLTDFKKDPERSFLSPRARRILLGLRQKHPVVMVSGRHVKGLERVSRLKGFPIIGTHGFEGIRLPKGLRLASRTRERLHAKEARALWRGLKPLAEGSSGLHLERKPYSSTLHYRGMALSPRQVAMIHRRFTSIFGSIVTRRAWTLMPGKKMIEAMPKGFSKGKSVRKLLTLFPGHTPIFAGDDLTDLSAMKVLPKRGLRIVIGNRIPAKYSDLCFPTPKAFIRWLEHFI